MKEPEIEGEEIYLLTLHSPVSATTAQAWNWRVPFLFILVGAVVALGNEIPTPGLDPQGIADQMQSSREPGVPARFSILALGLDSLLTVLILFEIVRLLIPRLAAWAARSPKGAGWIAFAIGLLALVIATLDAINVYVAFEYSALLSSELGAIPLHGIASLVAGVALLIWLADTIRLRTLLFAGFWIVWTIPVLVELPFALWDWGVFFRVGGLYWADLLVLVTVLGLGPIALVYAASALRGCVARGGGDPVAWSVLLVWPPLVAGSLCQFVASIAAEFAYTRFGLSFHPVFTIVWSGAMVLTLPLVMLLYVRTTRRAFPQGADWVGKRSVLGLLVLVQAGICIGLELNTLRWPISLHGSSLIALLTVSWALVLALRPVEPERTDRSQRNAPLVPNVTDRQWLEPWEPLGTTPADLRVRKQWEAELRRELAPDHVLHGLLPITMIARRFDREDALFQLEDGRVALVHLTWSQVRETDARFPQTTIHDTLDAWISTAMPGDHFAWRGRHTERFLAEGSHLTVPRNDGRE